MFGRTVDVSKREISMRDFQLRFLPEPLCFRTLADSESAEQTGYGHSFDKAVTSESPRAADITK